MNTEIKDVEGIELFDGDRIVYKYYDDCKIHEGHIYNFKGLWLIKSLTEKHHPALNCLTIDSVFKIKTLQGT